MLADKSTNAIRTLQSTPLNEAAESAPETKSNGKEKRSAEKPVNQARRGLPLPPPSVLGHP